MNQIYDTWSKELRIMALVGGFGVLLLLMWLFRSVLSPMTIAILLAYVMHPMVEFLHKRTRLGRTAAVTIVYFLNLILLLSIPAMLIPTLINQVQVLADDLPRWVNSYQEWIATPFSLLRWTISPAQFMPDIPAVSPDLLSPLVDNLFAFVGILTKNLFWVLIVLVSVYYLLRDGHRLTEWLLKAPPPRYQADFRHLYQQLTYVWGDYLRSQLAFMLAVGVLDTVIWLIVGLPGAVLLGFVTGLTSFVHEIGAIVSGVLSVMVALVEGSNYLAITNFWFAVLIFILYMILIMIKNIWLRPIITGRGVHLHPGIVFLVVLIGLVTYGALAAFIAVPALVSLLVIGRYLRRRILGMPPFPDGQDPSAYFPTASAPEPAEPASPTAE